MTRALEISATIRFAGFGGGGPSGSSWNSPDPPSLPPGTTTVGRTTGDEAGTVRATPDASSPDPPPFFVRRLRDAPSPGSGVDATGFEDRTVRFAEASFFETRRLRDARVSFFRSFFDFFAARSFAALRSRSARFASFFDTVFRGGSGFFFVFAAAGSAQNRPAASRTAAATERIRLTIGTSRFSERLFDGCRREARQV